jgi:hypothetical protein
MAKKKDEPEVLVDALDGVKEKRAGEQATRQVRLYGDIADMLGWIADLVQKDTGKKFSSARFLDPHVRPIILAAYEPYKARVEKIKKALDE